MGAVVVGGAVALGAGTRALGRTLRLGAEPSRRELLIRDYERRREWLFWGVTALAFLGCWAIYLPWDGIGLPYLLIGMLALNSIALRMGDRPTHESLWGRERSSLQRLQFLSYWRNAWFFLLVAPVSGYLLQDWVSYVYIVVCPIPSALYVPEGLGDRLRKRLKVGPLELGDLETAFDTPRARSFAPEPSTEVFGDETELQAFQVPAKEGNEVYLSRGLLGMLTPDELACVFAHELAHGECSHWRSLGSFSWLLWIVTFVGILWGLPLLVFSPGLQTLYVGLWLLMVLILRLLWTRRLRALELEADRRAVELVDEGELYGQTITKLIQRRRRFAAPLDLSLLSSHPELPVRQKAIDDHIRKLAAEGRVEDALAATIAVEPQDGIRALFWSPDQTPTLVLFERTEFRVYRFREEERAIRARRVPLDVVRRRAVAEESVPYALMVELSTSPNGDRIGVRTRDRLDETIETSVRPEDLDRLREVQAEVADLVGRDAAPISQVHLRFVAAIAPITGYLSTVPFGVDFPAAPLWLIPVGLMAVLTGLRSWFAALGAITLSVGLTSALGIGSSVGGAGGFWAVIAAQVFCGGYCLAATLLDQKRSEDHRESRFGHPLLVTVALLIVAFPGLLIAQVAQGGTPAVSEILDWVSSHGGSFLLLPFAGAMAGLAAWARSYR
ncbi:Protease HtpX [Planctomycetes bacterium Pan216]|uniref:Protease HtpX n=2 Tax=Kolteria novifilia TaxID=2527975 RepID=A0A518B740_9BACT|nr:Protease HtpX [Planctomycetes bacterium Pan216]